MKQPSLFRTFFPPLLALFFLAALSGHLLPDDHGWMAMFAAAALVALLFATPAARLMVGAITPSFQAMERRINQIAMGSDQTEVYPTATPAECRLLLNALDRLDDSVQTATTIAITSHTSAEAILASLNEGVVALDSAMNILRLNDSGRRLLGILSQRAEGEPLDRHCSEPALISYFTEAVAAGTPRRGEIELGEEEKRIVTIASAPLSLEKEESVGVVAAINDITELRRLESVRRQFAANVSHELRTPITSIKGFVETLAAGAIDDPDKGRSFLAIIDRHTTRLDSIIEELLQLSKVEELHAAGEIERHPEKIALLLARLLDDYADMAATGGIDLRLQCDSDIEATLNGGLYSQAIGNLIKNGIAHSPVNSAITLTAYLQGETLITLVKDEGKGVSPEDQSRIFERFYRVDQGRSRAAGGSGLGLSIVKHIATAHGGRVGVESHPGSGSIFTLVIPPAER